MQEPNATLYVKNIDWKVKKPLLKRALYSLFSRHGKVLEVIVLRRDGLRGQAWVIMEDVQASTAALQAENGFQFFNRDLAIEYAREKSDRIAKADGTFVPHKKKRQKINTNITPNKPPLSDHEEEEKEEETEQKNDSNDNNTLSTFLQPEEEGTSQQPALLLPPCKYLLAQKLPLECNEMMLGMLFRQYTGFVEVRMPRPGLAFVEFDDAAHATLALQALQGFQLSKNDRLHLEYGKND